MAYAKEYFLFTGGEGPDRRQAELFPVGGNIHHYSFPGIAHHVAAKLKELGAFDAVIQACFDRTKQLPSNIEYEILSPPRDFVA